MRDAVTIDQVNALVDMTNNRWPIFWVIAVLATALMIYWIIVVPGKIDRLDRLNAESTVGRARDRSALRTFFALALVPILGVVLTIGSVAYAATRDSEISADRRDTAIELLETDLGKPVQPGGIVPIRPGSDMQAIIGTEGVDSVYSTVYLTLDGTYLVSEIVPLDVQPDDQIEQG